MPSWGKGEDVEDEIGAGGVLGKVLGEVGDEGDVCGMLVC